MGNLFVSLRNAAGAMKVFERGMGVVQSNVTNASTAGYAKQTQILDPLRMDLDQGLPGGVASGGTLDSRSEYAEASVRRRLDSYGYADERSAQLEGLEPLFDIGGETGLGGAINKFFQSFSALTVAPNDLAARQVALDRADALARQFEGLAQGLQGAEQSAEQALVQRMEAINRTVAEIAEVNGIFRSDFRAQQDPGLQARMHNLTESLSEMADFTILRQDDGSATVYLGGQTMLVTGERQYAVRLDFGDPAGVKVLDAQGEDVTGRISGGRLRALLDVRNTIVPDQLVQLDRLAQAVADEVNTRLLGGVDLNGAPAAQGLFAYDAALGVARTIGRTPMTPQELPAAAPGSPGGNTVALEVAELAQQKLIDDYTFTQFYATQAAGVGRLVTVGRETSEVARQLVTQARQFREQAQSVNLDEEAVLLMQFQRAYQASAQMIKTLDEMTQTVLGLIG